MASRPTRALWTWLGLTRPELRAWALYDWADSAYVTTVITALFPIYFATVAAVGLPEDVATSRFAATSAGALAVAALVSPLLGALADRSGVLKRLLALSVALGVASCAGLFLVGPGDWPLGLVLFGLGNLGVTGSYVFYDALLRHLARDEELDRVSTGGYALGYLGGGVLLAAQLVLVTRPGWFGLADAASASRVAFLGTAVWWLVFSLPLLLRVPEPHPLARGRVSLRGALSELSRTARQLRYHRQALLVLVAYLLYSDGIGTIIRMATLYATGLGIDRGALMLALLTTQGVGIPATVLFGRLAGHIGAKAALLLALALYAGVSVLGALMQSAWHFFALAFLVALVQGGSQGLSRSLFAQLVPRPQAGQFFGVFSVFEKFTAVVGPAVFATVVATTGSSRLAVLSIIAFFVAGAAVLAGVDLEAGRREARAAEAEAEHAGAPPRTEAQRTGDGAPQ